MADYQFYTGILRFVAQTAARDDAKVAVMMDCLNRMADAIDAEGCFAIPLDLRGIYTRALAGVAGFLQDRILPEAVANQNKLAEVQIRWSVDTAMTQMTHLVKLQAHGDLEPQALFVLPPPPAVEGLE